MAEAFVQLAADGAGKRVRNVTAEVLQPDGTVATVYMQVLTLADAEGKILDLEAAAWRSAMLEAALKTNELLERIMETLG